MFLFGGEGGRTSIIIISFIIGNYIMGIIGNRILSIGDFYAVTINKELEHIELMQ